MQPKRQGESESWSARVKRPEKSSCWIRRRYLNLPEWCFLVSVHGWRLCFFVHKTALRGYPSANLHNNFDCSMKITWFLINRIEDHDQIQAHATSNVKMFQRMAIKTTFKNQLKALLSKVFVWKWFNPGIDQNQVDTFTSIQTFLGEYVIPPLKLCPRYVTARPL